MRDEFYSLSAFDVAIIGGGVIGLSIAREAATRGLRVAVIERGRFGGESSHAAAGMLAPQSEAERDDDFFRLACASRDMYPQFARELQDETNIDIELDTTGTLYLALNEADDAEIRHRHRWQSQANFAVELLTFDAARAREPRISPHTRCALLFPNDGQVENRRLIVALTQACENLGVRLMPHTEVVRLHSSHNQAQRIETTDGEIRAAHYVIASGAWSGRLLQEHLRNDENLRNDVLRNDDSLMELPRLDASIIEPVRGQMLCFEAVPPLVRRVVYSPRGYLVPRRDGRLLAGATTERAGFNKCVTAGGINHITTHALEIAPRLSTLPLVDSWAGLRPRSIDSLPIIGATRQMPNLIFATGHYRNGILLAPLTAHAVTDIITRTRTLDADTTRRLRSFSPARFYNSPFFKTAIEEHGAASHADDTASNALS